MTIIEGFYRFPIRTTNAGHKFFDNFATAQVEDRDPEIIKLELQREIAKFEGETAIYIAELNHESAMLKIAQDREIKIEDIGARLAAIREQTRSKERMGRISSLSLPWSASTTLLRYFTCLCLVSFGHLPSAFGSNCRRMNPDPDGGACITARAGHIA